MDGTATLREELVLSTDLQLLIAFLNKMTLISFADLIKLSKRDTNFFMIERC